MLVDRLRKRAMQTAKGVGQQAKQAHQAVTMGSSQALVSDLYMTFMEALHTSRSGSQKLYLARKYLRRGS